MASPAPQRARPHVLRAVLGMAVVAGAVIAGRSLGQLRPKTVPPGVLDPVDTPEVIISVCAILAVLVAGIFAVRALAASVRILIEQSAGDRQIAPLNLLVSFLGYIALAICILVLLQQPVGGILLGGALTGVLIGIAAQQVLANFFAGIVLLMVRPFTIADEIVLKSGPLGGEYEGLVTDMGLFYVKLQTSTGPVALPNAGVLASAIGPGVRAAEERGEEESQEGQQATSS